LTYELRNLPWDTTDNAFAGCSHYACAVSRDLRVRANISHIFEISDLDLPIHYDNV